MNIKCLADDYAVVERNDMFYAYNKLYEGAEKGLLLSSIIGLLVNKIVAISCYSYL